MYMRTGYDRSEEDKLSLEQKAVVIACVDYVCKQADLVCAAYLAHNELDSADLDIFASVIMYVLKEHKGPAVSLVYEQVFLDPNIEPDPEIQAEIFQTAKHYLQILDYEEQKYRVDCARLPPQERPSRSFGLHVVIQDLVKKYFSVSTEDTSPEASTEEDESSEDSETESESTETQEDEEEGDDVEYGCECDMCNAIVRYSQMDENQSVTLAPFCAIFLPYLQKS